jgi:ABC-type transport system involved in multi-copper enzyme maturation permease subunit
VISIALLSILGCALVFNGCTMQTESAIHQIYAAIQYCSGFMLIGIAMLINSVVGPRR